MTFDHPGAEGTKVQVVAHSPPASDECCADHFTSLPAFALSLLMVVQRALYFPRQAHTGVDIVH